MVRKVIIEERGLEVGFREWYSRMVGMENWGEERLR